MMATAPSVETAADDPASPKPQPSPPTHDVDSASPALNGNASHDEIENKRITNVEDRASSAAASVSGGSDTEASRADSAKLKDGDKNQGRAASSVKKPATFKAVSVNKTFLASKATAPTSTAKVSDKAKSGSSTPPTGSATLSVSRPRLVAKTGSGTRDSGQRLSGVNGGKPPAAPDANAVWNKNRPVPAPDPKKLTDEELKKYGIHVASRLDEDDTQGQNKWADLDDDDEDWAPESITWTDGTKTTLPHTDEPPPPRPASDTASAKGQDQVKTQSPAPQLLDINPQPKTGGLPTGKGLVLKAGAPEKPTLVAKPPAPQQPARSPWAALPPVERASPAATEPAAPYARGPPRETWQQKSMAPPGPPPREIAADDFSRSTWRDGAAHGNRELYNSQSGRYEPVPDRRGSMRADQPRHPAVLQRPGGDHPAEPSSAFQTHRTSQDGHFGRRRGSSNVSGGSGSFFQRPGKGPDGHAMQPPEFGAARRPSHAGSMEPPLSPVAVAAQVSHQGRYPHQPQTGYPPGPSPRTSFASMQQAAPTAPDSLPHAPAPQSIDEVEYQKRLMREKTELARKRRQEQEAAEEAARRERIQKKLAAMGPPPPKKSDKTEASPAQEPVKPTQIQQREQPETSTKPPQASPGQHGHTAEAAGPVSQSGRGELTSPPTSAPRRPSHGQESRPSGTWVGSRPERFVSWTPGSQPPRNGWGAPNNNRGLGNGTFDPDLGRIPGSSVPEPPAAKGPAPIAPPGAGREPRHARQPQPPAPIGSRPSRYGQPAPDLANKWVHSVAENDDKIHAARVAEKPDRERELAEKGTTLDDAQPSVKDTWRPVNVTNDGTRRPAHPAEPLPSQAGRRWQGTRDEPSREAPATAPHAGVIGSGGNSILPQAGQGTPSQSRTSSRFFPARDVRGDGSIGSRSRAPSPTPPPPTMEGHPAYDGNVAHPHVSLPRPPKPQPIVKLPPATSTSHPQMQPQPQPQTDRRPLAWATPTPYKDVVRAQPPHHQHRRSSESSQQNWQQKFNNLLNTSKHSPPKSMGVDPASKSALDYTIPQDPATVSLPGGSYTAVADISEWNASRPMAEECFDEPEIGSLPFVKLPHIFSDAAWQPAVAPTKPLPRRFVVQASAMDPFYFPAEVVSGSSIMRIRFPGMADAKTVTIPFPPGRGGRGSRRGHRGGSRGGNKKDAPSSHETSGSTTNSRGGRGRGGYRGRGSENWHRQSPAQSSQA